MNNPIIDKQLEIKKHSQKPIEIGDYVNVNVPYVSNVSVKFGKNKTQNVTENKNKYGYGKVINIIKDNKYGNVYAVEFNSWSLPHEVEKIKILNIEYKYGIELLLEEWIKPDFTKCGNTPFIKEPPRLNFSNHEIESILSKCGYRCYDNKTNIEIVKDKIDEIKDKNIISEKHLVGKTYGGVNFEPYVKDINGNRVNFQRDLVWTLEQKQYLIESIYNWIDIGKIVFRYKSWKQLEIEMIEDGHGYNYECIDGKQRLNTIIDFVQNKFKDLHGNYWSDLSCSSQRRLLGYDRLVYAQLEEDTTDENVIKTFLRINYTGVQMSQEHLEFVKSINIK